MTKRHTRLFFIVGTFLFAGIFIALTIHSHTQFDELTNAEMITPEVISGKHIWHKKNCVNCHTLMGEGAYYAPDLTEITLHRGEAYLKAFMRDPSRFYSEEEDRRLMPDPGLNDEEIDHVIAFLDWVSKIDRAGWPPRPIMVTNPLPGAYGGDLPLGAASDEPVEMGAALFRESPPGCVACHSTAPAVTLAGPSMAGMATRAAETVESADYEGSATTAEEYIRESIVDPNAFIRDVEVFGSEGRSLMPAHYEETLSADQIEALVAYLITLR